MSNRNPDSRNESLPELLDFHFKQACKQLHTIMPGVVRRYDPTTGRAEVQPALGMVLTDGSTMERPPIVDVPVVWPSGGGWSVTLPLEAGDPVILLIAERGLAAWKAADYGTARPGEGMFALESAVAIPGPGIPPADSETEARIEGPNGRVSVEDGLVKMEVGTTRAEVGDGLASLRTASSNILLTGATAVVEATNITLTGSVSVAGSMTLNGRPVTTHTHG